MHKIKGSLKHVTKKDYPHHSYQFHFSYVIFDSFNVLLSTLLIFEEEIAKVRENIIPEI